MIKCKYKYCLGGILLKRLFSCIVVFIVLLAYFPFSAKAEGESYIWALREVIEYNKSNEIKDYNNRYAGVYSLEITGAQGGFAFTYRYLGSTQQVEDGRKLQEGDSASSAVKFADVPTLIKPGELTELSVELNITSDNTSDKSFDFLPTKASAFFDKAGARPDIPSSNAIYFSEKKGEEKGTAVGTKSGQSDRISTSLYAQAPQINTERRIALCVCAEGILSVGTKYVYELIDENALDEDATDQIQYRKAAVRDITGSVFAINENKSILKEKDTVSPGTSVKTEKDSGCELYFDDKSFFRIEADSELLLAKSEVKDTVVQVVGGKAWAYIQPVVYGGSFTIKTKYADLKIKGTIFAIEEGKEYSEIWLFTGYASVIIASTDEIIEIEAGQKITVRKDGGSPEYFTITENIDQWGIPISAIREDSGYAWVKYLVIALAVFTAVLITTLYLTIYIKKQKKKKAVSNTAPEEGQCQFCGNHLEPEDTFCQTCGAAVKRTKPEETTQER